MICTYAVHVQLYTYYAALPAKYHVIGQLTFCLEKMQIVNRGGLDQKVIRNDAVHDGGM